MRAGESKRERKRERESEYLFIKKAARSVAWTSKGMGRGRWPHSLRLIIARVCCSTENAVFAACQASFSSVFNARLALVKPSMLLGITLRCASGRVFLCVLCEFGWGVQQVHPCLSDPSGNCFGDIAPMRRRSPCTGIAGLCAVEQFSGKLVAVSVPRHPPHVLVAVVSREYSVFLSR